VVNDVYTEAGKYHNVRYVIENLQSDKMANCLEEALRDKGIPVQRVTFTNFPKSLPGVDSLHDVFHYNKGLVTPATVAAEPTSAPLPGRRALTVMVGGLLRELTRKKSKS
jgi:zinc/manganese transport system substrate-binding protein